MNTTTFKIVDSQYDRESVIRQLDHIAKGLPNGYYDITIKKYKRSRTERQNALYWAIIGQLAEDTGYCKDDIHNFMSSIFLRYYTKCFKGKRMWVKSTTKLSVKEFNEYIDKVVAFIQTEIYPEFKMPTYDTIGLEEE